MKTTNKNRYKLQQVFALFLLLLFIPSCMVDEQEQIIGQGGTQGNSDNTEVTFQVKLPGAVSMATRALNYEQENYVEEMTLFIFNPDTKDFITHLSTTNITDSNSDSRYKKFVFTLPQGKMDLVFLANAWGPVISEYLKDETLSGKKEDILKKMILTHTGRWISDNTDSNYIPIPMWGEVEGVTITGDSTQFTGTDAIPMVRMMAKIDVEVTGSALNNFDLHEIYLYNRNTQGKLVPTEAGNWNNTDKKVIHPEVPGDSVTIGPLPYFGSDITTPLIASNSVIYTMEAIAGKEDTYLKNTCLVVGGDYERKGKITYYRIDFHSDTTGYLPLLRNHLYQIRIKAISGAGYNTPDEAFSARPVNIEADVHPWDDGGMTEVVIDGQYLLSVSQGKFNFAREATNTMDTHNILTVYTDYESGWTIEKIVDEQGTDISNDWLKVTITNGAAGNKQSTQLILTQNISFTSRTGYIHIRAGRLTYEIKVVQSHVPDLRLAIYEGDGSTGKEIGELTFSGVPQGTQQFTVDWAPSSAQPSISITSAAVALFSYDPSHDVLLDGTSITDGQGGKRTYTILPPAMNSNETYEKGSRIDFTVSNGESQMVRSIFLRQLNFGLNIVSKQETYLLDGKIHEFTIRSNASWIAQVTSDPQRLMSELRTTTGNGNNIPETIEFRTADYMSSEENITGTVIITFSNHLFGSVDVEINCASGEIKEVSNSYIVKPNGKAILIPVKRANEYTKLVGKEDAIGDDTPFTAALVWTEHPKGKAEDSNIRDIAAVGTGKEGYILVVPGSGQGNAVVSVRVNGVVVWSWHIWVMDDEPVSDHVASNGKGLMDRNLGAITKTPSSTETTSYGLLYQWGRKDPFPGGGEANPTDDTGIYIYHEGGRTSIFTETAPTTTGTENNMDISIQNPTTFYAVSSIPNDWYSTTHHNDALWNQNGKKTIYDPCPEGWRVPYYNGSDSPWSAFTSNFPWNVHGRIYNNQSYYPAAGFRNVYGTIGGTGRNGYIWTATPTATPIDYSYGMTFTNVQITLAETTLRARAASVRCMQE